MRPPATFDPVLSPDHAGWTWDPSRRYDYLWWDGTAWTARKIGGPPAGYYKRPPRRHPTFVLSGEPHLPLVRRLAYRRRLIGRRLAYVDVGDGFAVLGGRGLSRLWELGFGETGAKAFLFADSSTIVRRGLWLLVTSPGSPETFELRNDRGLRQALVEHGFTIVDAGT